MSVESVRKDRNTVITARTCKKKKKLPEKKRLFRFDIEVMSATGFPEAAGALASDASDETLQSALQTLCTYEYPVATEEQVHNSHSPHWQQRL